MKRLSFFLLSIVMVVTFSVGNSIEANAAYACSSGESRCADAKLTYGGSKTAFSASVVVF